MALRERLHELIDELTDDDLAGVEPLLKELALRRRVQLKSVEMQTYEGGSGTASSNRRAATDGKGIAFNGWDELWADFHWGRRR